VSVNQPSAREDVWQARPGGDGSPADRDAGVWQVGGVVHGGCGAPARRAPARFVLIGWWWRNGTLVVMAAVFALSFIWIQLIAQRHGLVVGLLRARTRQGQVAQRRMRVSVIVLVCLKWLHHRCLPEVGPVVAVPALRA
jgi:hypothetical protein